MDSASPAPHDDGRRWVVPDETWQRNLKNRIQSSFAPLVRDAQRQHMESLHMLGDDDPGGRAAATAAHEQAMDAIRRRAQVEFDTHLNGEILQRRFVADEELGPEEWHALQKYQQTLYDHVAKGSPDRPRTISNAAAPLSIERRTSASSTEPGSFTAPVHPPRPVESRPRGNSVASASSMENHLWSQSGARNRTSSASGSVDKARPVESTVHDDHWTRLTPPEERVPRITHVPPPDSGIRQRATSRSTSRGRVWRPNVSPGPRAPSSRTLVNALIDPPAVSTPPTTTKSDGEEVVSDSPESSFRRTKARDRPRPGRVRSGPGSPSMMSPLLLNPPQPSASQSLTLLEARGTPTGSPTPFEPIDLSPPLQPLPSRPLPPGRPSRRMLPDSMHSLLDTPPPTHGFTRHETPPSAPAAPTTSRLLLGEMMPPPRTGPPSAITASRPTPEPRFAGSTPPVPFGKNKPPANGIRAVSQPYSAVEPPRSALSSSLGGMNGFASAVETRRAPLSSSPGATNGFGVAIEARRAPLSSSPGTLNGLASAVEARRAPLSSSPSSPGYFGPEPPSHVNQVKLRRGSASSMQATDDPALNPRFRRPSASSVLSPADDSSEGSRAAASRALPILQKRRSANFRDDADAASPRSRAWFTPEPVPEDRPLELPEPSPTQREPGSARSRPGSLRARPSRDYLRFGPDLYNPDNARRRSGGYSDGSDDEGWQDVRSIRSVDVEEVRRRDSEARRREEELQAQEDELRAKEDEVRTREADVDAARTQVAEKEDAVRRMEDEARRLEAALALQQAEVGRKEEEVKKELADIRRREEAVRREQNAARVQVAEARRKEEDARRREEDARKEREDARKNQEDARAAAEESRRVADEARRAAEDAKRQADAARRKEEIARRQAERKEEEAKRKEAEAHLQVEQARLELQRKEEEARRQVDEARQEAKRKEEEVRRKEEEFRKREIDLQHREEELARREELQKKEKELFEREQLLKSREEMQRHKELAEQVPAAGTRRPTVHLRDPSAQVDDSIDDISLLHDPTSFAPLEPPTPLDTDIEPPGSFSVAEDTSRKRSSAKTRKRQENVRRPAADERSAVNIEQQARRLQRDLEQTLMDDEDSAYPQPVFDEELIGAADLQAEQAAAEARLHEEVAQRVAEQRRLAEEARARQQAVQQAAEWRRIAEHEQAAAEARRLEDEARARQAADQRRRAEETAAATRAREDARARQAADDRRRAEEAFLEQEAAAAAAEAEAIAEAERARLEEEETTAAQLHMEEEMALQQALQREMNDRRQHDLFEERRLREAEQLHEDERFAKQLAEEEERQHHAGLQRQRRQQHEDSMRRLKEEEQQRVEDNFRLSQEAERRRREEEAQRQTTSQAERKRREDVPRQTRFEDDELEGRFRDQARRPDERKRQDSPASFAAASSASAASASASASRPIPIRTNPIPIATERSSGSTSNWSIPSSATGWSSSTRATSTSTAPPPRPPAPAPVGSAPAAAAFRPTAGGGGTSPNTGPSYGTPGNSRPSPMSEGDWARRQAEQAKKQQEQFVRDQERTAREKQTKASRAFSREDVAELFKKHEQQWQLVRSAPKLRWDTFPWPVFRKPSVPEDLTADAIAAYVLSAAVPTESGKSDKDRIKEQIKRWHPDRFETQLLPKVNEEEREKVKEGAGSVARALNELLTRSNTAGLFG